MNYLLTASYPWYTPYQFTGNNPIRSIDLDGLEELGVIFSPYHAGRVKTLIEVGNYRKAYEILEYGMSHGFVDSNGRTSKWLHNKYKEKRSEKAGRLGWGGNASIILPFREEPEQELVEKYGDIDDHGGYIRLEFFNWETNSYEDLGVMPLSKINENANENGFITMKISGILSQNTVSMMAGEN